jgi:hypothetical protein
VGGLWRPRRASSRPANPVAGIRGLVAGHEEWLAGEALCRNGPPKALQNAGPCTVTKSLFCFWTDVYCAPYRLRVLRTVGVGVGVGVGAGAGVIVLVLLPQYTVRSTE